MASEPLVLEHDPDSEGCQGCPLFAREPDGGPWCGKTSFRHLGMREPMPGDAPSACPLRTGPVLIRTPESRDE